MQNKVIVSIHHPSLGLPQSPAVWGCGEPPPGSSVLQGRLQAADCTNCDKDTG